MSNDLEKRMEGFETNELGPISLARANALMSDYEQRKGDPKVYKLLIIAELNIKAAASIGSDVDLERKRLEELKNDCRVRYPNCGM